MKKIEIQEGSETRQRVESVRLYGFDEIMDLLAEAGFRPGHVFGDLGGSPFDRADSPRLVVIGEACG